MLTWKMQHHAYENIGAYSISLLWATIGPKTPRSIFSIQYIFSRDLTFSIKCKLGGIRGAILYFRAPSIV